ncbi:hypothetical protein MW887_003857 [Aspergillus wentii]|nr:hypothetical protein MW887_003857 [Aspergillus wentii]
MVPANPPPTCKRTRIERLHIRSPPCLQQRHMFLTCKWRGNQRRYNIPPTSIGQSTKDNLRRKPRAQAAVSWEREFRETFKHGTLAAELVAYDDELGEVNVFA